MKTPLLPAAIKPDGRLEESLPEMRIGEQLVTMEWSLIPDPP